MVALPAADFTDVLVCGAGPVGLLTALGLAQQGVKSLVIEKKERRIQETFGRACTLYPRSLELLEQFGVVSQMLQVGFYGRSYAEYQGGQKVVRSTFQSVFPSMQSSFHNYVLNIRQKLSENIFATKYVKEFGGEVRYGWQLVRYEIDTELGDGYNVTAVICNQEYGEKTIRCKYIVGADGGQSTVRKLANIEMQGSDTTYKWIRIDGHVKTNMPEPNLSFASIYTETHGSVLWVKLDGDAVRIGFALNAALQAKYPDGPTQEQAVKEAAEAIYPLTLEFERVDWWTYYTIKQKVASTFHKDSYILLAGDAGHTHSSGFAQGMNTGIHDASNLAWKLSGTLKGLYKPSVLATYSTERRTIAQKLIDIDTRVAAAISGDLPPEFKALGLSPVEALRTISQTNIGFTTGLSINYEDSVLIKASNAGSLVAGSRAPDALVYAPGPSVPMRLHSVLSDGGQGRWKVIVFAGLPIATKTKFSTLRKESSNADPSIKAKWAGVADIFTIMIGTSSSAWMAFDGDALGNLYFDLEAIAHSQYGIYPELGGIVVVRPDGVVAFAAGLDAWEKIDEFFNSFCM